MTTLRMTVPEVFTAHPETAVKCLRTYYSDRLEPRPGDEPESFTGAFFDRWPDEPDPDPDVFTAEDLIAVQCLSVTIPAAAAVDILHRRRDSFSDLLRRIPRDLDLVDVPGENLNPSWPAWELERKLREYDGIGPVKATKLIARKRPRLYPIYDELVSTEIGTPGRILVPLHTALREDPGLMELLRELRGKAGLPDTISEIRVFDVVTWMTAKDRAASA